MSRLVDTPAYKALEAHQAKLVQDKVHMRDLFANDPQRFEKFSLHFQRKLKLNLFIYLFICILLLAAELLIDLSKNIMTDETRTLLEQLAVEGNLNQHIQALFNGEVKAKKEKKERKQKSLLLRQAFVFRSVGFRFAQRLSICRKSTLLKIVLFCTLLFATNLIAVTINFFLLFFRN
jgi:hypothetical protein